MSVSGELQVEQGQPVIQGTDDRPLLLSDARFDGHRRWLQKHILRYGAISFGLCFVAVSLWFGFYVPLAVLVVGYLGYVGYHSIEDLRIFREFLERLWNKRR